MKDKQTIAQLRFELRAAEEQRDRAIATAVRLEQELAHTTDQLAIGQTGQVRLRQTGTIIGYGP